MKRYSLPVLVVAALVGCTATAASPHSSPSTTPTNTVGLSIAKARGAMPTTSPDGSMIAFLRDPPDPKWDGNGDPYLLQLWLVRVDGSGLRKLAQQHACCLGLVPHVSWSPDSSSIVFTGTHMQTVDVQPLPVPASPG
jgi:Tol biopolymer transport system component